MDKGFCPPQPFREGTSRVANGEDSENSHLFFDMGLSLGSLLLEDVYSFFSLTISCSSPRGITRSRDEGLVEDEERFKSLLEIVEITIKEEEEIRMA